MISSGFEQINGFVGKYMWLDVWGIFFAQYFEYVLLFCVVIFLFLPIRFSWLGLIEKAKKNYIIFAQAIFAAVISRFVFTEIIHYVLPVSRPFVDNDVNLLFNYAAISSFPSGHAAFYFALCAVIFYYEPQIFGGEPNSAKNSGVHFLRSLANTNKRAERVCSYSLASLKNRKAGIAAFGASFLICIARVFCGIHWPLDIAAGFVVGVFTASLTVLGPKLRKRRIERAKKQ